MRFIVYSNSLIYILSLSNSYNNVASIQRNRADKPHRVIVALVIKLTKLLALPKARATRKTNRGIGIILFRDGDYTLLLWRHYG